VAELNTQVLLDAVHIAVIPHHVVLCFLPTAHQRTISIGYLSIKERGWHEKSLQFRPSLTRTVHGVLCRYKILSQNGYGSLKSKAFRDALRGEAKLRPATVSAKTNGKIIKIFFQFFF
jgi:hypothetical protein